MRSQERWRQGGPELEPSSSPRQSAIQPSDQPIHPLNVLHVIPGLGIGGTERSLAEILPVLSTFGISSSVVCFFRRDGVQQLVVKAGVDVRFLQARTWRGRIRELRAILQRERPDILHSVLFEADLVGRLAAWRTGVPVLTSLVSTPYEPVRLQDPNVRRTRLAGIRLIDSWTARHFTTHFHAITSAVKTSAMRHLGLPPGCITVVERGRDEQRLGERTPIRRARNRLNLGLTNEDLLVLNVGRQEFAKGQRVLVEAFARVLKHVPRARLLVVGPEGHASADVQRAVSVCGLNQHVEVQPDRTDIPDLMTAADLFAFPSLYEGLPGVVIEAMALNLPVVASDLPAIREIVEEGRSALLAPPGSPRELAAAMVSLLNDPGLRDSFGRRGREIFVERFTLERSARGMTEMYQALADPPRVRGAN